MRSRLRLGLFAAAVTAAGLSGCGSPDYCDDPMVAWQMAKEFVTRELRAPATASFPWYDKAFVSKAGSCSYDVMGYVDAQNGFGANIRSTFTVTVTYDRSTTLWESSGLAIF